MRESGYRIEDIAKYLNLNPDTIYRYQKEKSELNEVLKRGTNELILDIQDTLFKKAKAGDITAIIFALKGLTAKNKDASIRWLDKYEIEDNQSKTIDDGSVAVADALIKREVPKNDKQ